MPNLNRPTPTGTVTLHHPEWPADFSVEIRERKTWPMAIRATNRADRKTMTETPRATFQKMAVRDLEFYIMVNRDTAELNQALMEEMIVSWTARYPDGDPIPCTPATFQSVLTEEDIAYLISEINDRGGSQLGGQPEGADPFPAADGMVIEGRTGQPDQPADQAGAGNSGDHRSDGLELQPA